MSQRPARERFGRLAVFDGGNAVDDYQWNAFRRLEWMLIGGAIDDLLRLEGDDVGGESRAKITTIGQTKDVGR